MYKYKFLISKIIQLEPKDYVWMRFFFTFLVFNSKWRATIFNGRVLFIIIFSSLSVLYSIIYKNKLYEQSIYK